MRYRVKHDFLWFKKDAIVDVNKEAYFYSDTGGSDAINTMNVNLNDFPNDFEPIDEEEEKDLEAKKRLEERGYVVKKKEEFDDISDLLRKKPIMCRHNFVYGMCVNCGVVR